MTDEHTIAVLRRAGETIARGHSLDPDVAARAWSAGSSRPSRTPRRLAVAATIVGVAGAATALALTRTGDRTPSAATSACAGTVSTAALPEWARAGFMGSGLHTPHVFGEHRQIVAVLFVPLRVRQPAGTHNKILWVSRQGFGPLHIRARLEGSQRTVERTVPNGPSYVNMPAPGCWQLTLAWSGQRDTIALRYAP